MADSEHTKYIAAIYGRDEFLDWESLSDTPEQVIAYVRQWYELRDESVVICKVECRVESTGQLLGDPIECAAAQQELF